MTPDPKLVQQFIANSFGIGIIRRMAPPGTLTCVINFLKELDLGGAPSHSSEYAAYLDDLTKRFITAMPEGAKHWGMARKCLNLFFRDSLYNFYLREAHGLGKFESVMEIPLDSYVGNALRNKRPALPAWDKVIKLTEADSAQFQAAAADIAAETGTFRVHLDLGYWRGETSPATVP